MAHDCILCLNIYPLPLPRLGAQERDARRDEIYQVGVIITIFAGLIQNKIFNYSFKYFVGQNWKKNYQLWLNQAPLLILCLCNWGGVYGRRSPRVKEVEGFKLQVINNSNIVVCV